MQPRLRPLSILLFVVASVLGGACATSPVAGDGAYYDLSSDAVSTDGYDVVAYFTENRAREGSPSLSYVHEGVTYYFASEEHRSLFAAEPNKYIPAWGSWCAYAVANEGTFGADPESFLIVDGRLFLFHDSIFFDAKKAWLEKDRHAAFVKTGDAYWKRMLAGEES